MPTHEKGHAPGATGRGQEKESSSTDSWEEHSAGQHEGEAVSCPSPFVAYADEQLEASLLGGLALDPERLEELPTRLDAEDFALPESRLIFGAIVELHRKGAPTDLQTLPNHLEKRGQLDRAGGLSHIAEVLSCVVTSSRVEYDAAELAKRANERKSLQAARKLVDDLVSGKDPEAAHAKYLQASVRREASRPRLRLADWQASDRFAAEPPPREWLVQDIFPKGTACMVAGAGGVGKSFMLLQLARAVAVGDTLAENHFGGQVQQRGKAVYITIEDDHIELHNRLKSLGPSQGLGNLIAVPVPSAGGLGQLFTLGPNKGQQATEAWYDLTRQIEAMDGLKLVVLDPLQTLCSFDLNVPENCQFVCAQVAELAGRTGATVIISHHFRKGKVTTLSEAREAIRGSGGLVDGLRASYALWPVELKKKQLRDLGFDGEEGCVAGGIVKANGKHCKRQHTYVRALGSGRLLDITRGLLAAKGKCVPDDLKGHLVAAIRKGAADGYPFPKSGQRCLFKRKPELDPSCHEATRNQIEAACEELLLEGRIVQAVAKGAKKSSVFDVPDGPFARGEGEFAEGAPSK